MTAALITGVAAPVSASAHARPHRHPVRRHGHHHHLVAETKRGHKVG